MKAVILAAGKGTRMGGLIENRPKTMLPVVNRPLLEHIIVIFKEAGIREFLIVVGYFKEKITEYFGDGSNIGINIQYVEQQEQRGTADAISVVRDSISIEERFLVTNGDVLTSVSDIKNLYNTRGIVLSAKQMANINIQEYGLLYVKGKKVEKIIEKSKESVSCLSGLINAGIYVFDTDIFHAIDNTIQSQRGEYEITDSIQSLIDLGKDVVHMPIERYQNIEFPWQLLEINEMLLNEGKSIRWDIQGEIEPYTTLKGNVAIGKNTIIRNGSYIIGPVIIGNNCDIGPNCYIRPATSISDDVRIGNAVEIKNSIIMKGTKIGHLSYVGDSVIGENCNFGAGTKVANLRHDNRTVMMEIAGKRFDSGRKKLGVIMGDNVNTGINSSINVGTTITSRSNINPGEFIRKDIKK